MEKANAITWQSGKNYHKLAGYINMHYLGSLKMSRVRSKQCVIFSTSSISPFKSLAQGWKCLKYRGPNLIRTTGLITTPIMVPENSLTVTWSFLARSDSRTGIRRVHVHIWQFFLNFLTPLSLSYYNLSVLSSAF